MNLTIKLPDEDV